MRNTEHGPSSPKKSQQRGNSEPEQPLCSHVPEETEGEGQEMADDARNDDGWIWPYGALKHMSDKDMKAWEEECEYPSLVKF